MDSWQTEILRAILGAGGWLMLLITLIIQRRRATTRRTSDTDVSLAAGRDVNLHVYAAPPESGPASAATSELSLPQEFSEPPPEARSAETSDRNPRHRSVGAGRRRRSGPHQDQLRLPGF